MTKPEAGARVRAIISDHLQKFGRPAEVTDASTLHDVGLDSLDQIEVTFAIEDEFDLELTDAEVEDLVTVGDLVELIGGRLGVVVEDRATEAVG